MAETSFDAVRKGVIAKLKASFPVTDVYGEDIEQNFKEPCFFVKLFPASQERVMGNRYKRYHAFDVHYFPDSQYVNEAAHSMAEELYQVLEYITVNGDTLAGTKMEHEVVDGVLHFFVQFNPFVYRQQPIVDKMTELTVQTNLRGDE